MMIKKNDLVTLPKNWTYGGRKFKVVRVYKNKDLQLQFLGGKEKGEKIDRYGQDEVLPL